MNQTSREYMRTLSVMHFMIIAILVLIGIAMSLYVLINKSMLWTEVDNLLLIANPITSLFCMVLSVYVFRKNMIQNRTIVPLEAKLNTYKTAMIKMLFMNEVAVFITFASVYITGNFWHLTSGVLVIGFMILKRPTVKSIIKNLDLNHQESSILENPDANLTL